MRKFWILDCGFWIGRRRLICGTSCHDREGAEGADKGILPPLSGCFGRIAKRDGCRDSWQAVGEGSDERSGKLPGSLSRTQQGGVCREAGNRGRGSRRYDLDGVELDWLRYPKFFRDGEVNAAVLTEFVREVRAILDEAAKRRGHGLRLVTRVPDSPVRAKEIGLDVETWLKAGWIDAVIAGNGFTFASNSLDQWVALAHRHHVPVYGVIERMPRGFARYGTPETLRAAAATLWARGADGLYTFNFCNTAEYPQLTDLADPAKLALLPKEFFLDACRTKANNNTVSRPPLPLTIQTKASGSAVLFITDDPAQAKDLRLELAWKGSGDFAVPEIVINGQKLEELKMEREKSSFTAASAYPLEKGESPLTVTCSSPSLAKMLRRGANEFVFTSPSTATLTALSLRITPDSDASGRYEPRRSVTK